MGNFDGITHTDEGTLVNLWDKPLLEMTIPRAVHFVNSYDSLLVFSLETGEV